MILKGLGIQYIHMSANSETQLWVHCAANMRVSAFMYHYRTSELGQEEAIARSDMNKIWETFGVWRKFVGWD